MKQTFSANEISQPDVRERISSRLKGSPISIHTGFEQQEIDRCLDSSATTTLMEVDANSIKSATIRLADMITDDYDYIMICVSSGDMNLQPSTLAPLVDLVGDINPESYITWALGNFCDLKPGEYRITMLCGKFNDHAS